MFTPLIDTLTYDSGDGWSITVVLGNDSNIRDAADVIASNVETRKAFGTSAPALGQRLPAGIVTRIDFVTREYDVTGDNHITTCYFEAAVIAPN